MKRSFFKLAAFAAVALVAVSCDDTTNENEEPTLETTYDVVTEADLPGIAFSSSSASSSAPSWASESLEWSKTGSAFYASQAEADAALASATAMTESNATYAAGVYSLDGVLKVVDGETLTLEAGVVIIAKGDDTLDYIIVEQGGKIVVKGTEANPVIMTSTNMYHGGWGGLHLCGKALINVTGGTGTSEIGDATYGGSDDSDSSGSLEYLRVEFGGYALSTTKEANGITFYGVGNGTKVAYCHAYKGSDDGYEWFGGCVNCSYLISTDNWDDSFDWTYGFTGELTNIYGVHLSTDCDKLIEADNNSSDYSATPISNPTITNAVLVGQDGDNSRGVRIRVGSRVTMSNVHVTGNSKSFDIISEETAAYFKATPGAFSNVYASGTLDVSDLEYL